MVTAPLRLRLLHVCAPAPYGGLERVVTNLCIAQERRGHRVTLAAILGQRDDEPGFLDAIRAAGCDVQLVRAPSRGYPSQVRQLRLLRAASGSEIVHTHGYQCDVLSMFFHGAAPRVSTIHGFVGGGAKARAFEWLQVRCLRSFDAVVPVSDLLRTQLGAAGVAPSRLHTIRNAWVATPGVAAPVERSESSAGAVRLAWVGRISHEKGLDVAIAALPQTPDAVELTVIGDGPDREAATRLAERLGVAHRVRWLGSVPNAGNLLESFDALVLSSRTEGTPMTLLEAMHAEVPIIAAAVGGVPAMLRSDEALLVPAEAPRQLADAIRALAGDPVAAKAGAARARVRLQKDFGEEAWLAAYDDVYYATLGR